MLDAINATNPLNPSIQRRAVTESGTCSGGGSLNINGNVDDTTLTGTLNISYTNCTQNGVTLNGPAVLVIHRYNPVYDELESFTLSYNQLNVTENTESYTLTGTSLIDRDLVNSRVTSTENMMSTKGGKQVLYENFVTEIPVNLSLSMGGKIYHEDFGYVTVLTETVLGYFSSNDSFPSNGGPVIATGVSEKKLKLIPLSSEQIRAELDLDGDGTYERFATVDNTASTSPQGNNNTPTAVITGGQSTTIALNVEITLDGSGSTDPDPNDIISYRWELTRKPASSQAIVSTTSAPTTAFTADIPGTYEVSLTVTDQAGASDTRIASFSAITAPAPLSHNVLDAVYSKPANRLIVVTTNPADTLRIINPETGVTEQQTTLPKTPLSVAVSADGSTIAVGYDTGVGYYPANAISMGNVWSVPLKVGDIEVDDSGFIYLSPAPGTQWDAIYTFDPSNQSSNAHTGSSIYAGSKIKLQPGAQALYGANNGLSPSDVNKLDISSNPAIFLYDSPYHGDYAFSGDLWFTEDGNYFITASGNLFQTAADRNTDMLYRGSAIVNANYQVYLVHADHSQSVNRFVTVISDSTANSAAPDSEIRLFETPFLAQVGTFSFKNYSLDGSPNRVIAQFAFYNNDGSKYYVIAKTEGTDTAQQGATYLIRFQ